MIRSRGEQMDVLGYYWYVLMKTLFPSGNGLE